MTTAVVSFNWTVIYDGSRGSVYKSVGSAGKSVGRIYESLQISVKRVRCKVNALRMFVSRGGRGTPGSYGRHRGKRGNTVLIIHSFHHTKLP